MRVGEELGPRERATRPFDKRRPVPTGDILQTQRTARSIVKAARCGKPTKVGSVQKRESRFRENREGMGHRRTIAGMDPITTVTSTWGIAKTAGEISKKLYEFAKSLKDRELKHQVDEILDQVRELKQLASQLEDENRGLREQLRFRTDDYEFRTPFYYEKSHQDRPLCPKCFAKNVAAPMGEPGQGCAAEYRCCLVCGGSIQVGHRSRQAQIRPIIRPYT